MMPTKKLYFMTLTVSVAFSVIVAFFLEQTMLLWISFLIGILISALTLWMFFKAWNAAPDSTVVVTWYAVRAVITFGSIIIAMFQTFPIAIGVLVPQLFPVPLLAVFMILGKRKGD